VSQPPLPGEKIAAVTQARKKQHNFIRFELALGSVKNYTAFSNVEQFIRILNYSINSSLPKHRENEADE